MILTDDRRLEIKRELARVGVSLGARHRFDCFGNTPELAAGLGALVATGVKSATSAYEGVYARYGLEVPSVGDIVIVCDFQGVLLAVIEMTDVESVPFDEVGEEHARLEGEGDGSLDHWRDVHRAYFRENCTRMGVEFSERDRVCCQRFRLRHVP